MHLKFEKVFKYEIIPEKFILLSLHKSTPKTDSGFISYQSGVDNHFPSEFLLLKQSSHSSCYHDEVRSKKYVGNSNRVYSGITDKVDVIFWPLYDRRAL